MESLVDVVDMIEDNVEYYKQQNPVRVKIFDGDTLFRDNEGTHNIEFRADIVNVGIDYRISFPIKVEITATEDEWNVEAEAQDTDEVTITDENDNRVDKDRSKAMDIAGINFDLIDQWALKYCIK